MHRDCERSRIVFPGLVVLALLLFCVPEASVDAARARALSALRPILINTASWRKIEPRTAPAAFNMTDPTLPASPDKPVAIKREIDPAEYDALRIENMRLLVELKRVQLSQHFD